MTPIVCTNANCSCKGHVHNFQAGFKTYYDDKGRAVFLPEPAPGPLPDLLSLIRRTRKPPKEKQERMNPHIPNDDETLGGDL